MKQNRKSQLDARTVGLEDVDLRLCCPEDERSSCENNSLHCGDGEEF